MLRVLNSRPSILIADEILCGLDMKTQARLLILIKRRQAEAKFPVLYMTCEMGPLQMVADQVSEYSAL
jgi:ABC-type dipeptide/oligopeptide/nickel transport system ATPase component